MRPQGQDTRSIRYFGPTLEKILAQPESAASRLDDLLGIHASKGRSISEYWRKNTHHLESSELAAVLRALRKVAGYIGRNPGRIEWAGMSQYPRDVIVLDPGLVMGQYPVPFHRFDYLTGLVAHEGLHRTEWSDLLWKKTLEVCPQMKPIAMIRFQKMVATGEDIYVDLFSEKSMLGLYTRVARNAAITECRRELRRTGAHQLTVDDLMLLWWQRAFATASPSPSSAYGAPLDVLDRLTRNLKEISCSSQSVIRRCDLRCRLYLDGWHALEKEIAGWKVVNKTLMWHPPSADKNGKTQPENLNGKKPQSLNHDLALDVGSRLAAYSSDITPIIQTAAGRDNADVIPTSKWDYNNPCHPVIDQKLVGRLKGVIQQYADRRAVLNRGLLNGRVDRKRLYRAPITGRCFFDRQRIPVVDWNMCLLIDASGSMAGPRWRMVENILGILHRAFRGFQNRLQAYAYFEIEGMCMISSLIKGKQLLSVPPAGQTASGQAIIAAAHFMPRDARRKFLVHITDGESNIGCDVAHGIRYCQSKSISLVTLGVAYKDRNLLKKQYKGSIFQFLDHLGQLPSALEKVLQWIMLYDNTSLRKTARPTAVKHSLPG